MSAALTDPRRPQPVVAGAGATISLLDPAGPLPYPMIAPPPGFDDLHLAAALATADDFQRAVWYAPPSELATVGYRQEVVAELREPAFDRAATGLVAAITGARRAITAFRTSHYPLPAELLLAAAVDRYAASVGTVVSRLDELRPTAAGLRGLAAYLSDYVAGREFRELAESTVLRRIGECTVELGIHQGTVWADQDQGRPGWGERIEQVFGRFREPGEPVAAEWSRPRRHLNHVEAQAIGLVNGLFPELFAELHAFVAARTDFLPATLERLAEELRFYLDFLHLADDLSTRGVAWCLPRLAADRHAPVRVSGMVDLALAVGADQPPVANDLLLAGHSGVPSTASSAGVDGEDLSRAPGETLIHGRQRWLTLACPELVEGSEPVAKAQFPMVSTSSTADNQRSPGPVAPPPLVDQVVFITGPNQGGKTTFARSIGQLAYLAGLGLPVPARSASLPWSQPVLTHFPAPDDPDHDRGGLADELHRLHEVLALAGPRALLVFNELFSATSAADALQLSARVMERIQALGCRVVWVTFLEELVLGTPGAVSLVGQVAPDDPTRPTFRFRAQPPGGRSHAVALAARHGLSSADLAERLR